MVEMLRKEIISPTIDPWQDSLRYLHQHKPGLIPMTYIELYPKLVQYGLLMSIDIPPLQPLYPKWYNENVHYDYHFGNRGHSTKNCTALK